MSNKAGMILNSNDAMLWFDGEILAELSKATAKATKESDDVTFVGDPRTYKRSKGYKVEGSITIKRINSKINRKVAAAMKAGIDLDSKIIAKQANPKGQAERIALTGVDIAELVLFDWEAQGNMEQEFPFTAVDFNYLDYIN